MPYVFATEAVGQDEETLEKIRFFTYEAGLILSAIRLGVAYGAIPAKVLPLTIDRNHTNMARVEINDRMYLVEITPLNF